MTCHLKWQNSMFNTWYSKLGDKVKRTVIFHSVETPACLASSCHFMSFSFPLQATDFFVLPHFIFTLILYDFVSKAQLLHFPLYELSCIGALSSYQRRHTPHAPGPAQSFFPFSLLLLLLGHFGFVESAS